MPFRLEVGPRDVAAGQGVLVRRVDRDKEPIALDALAAELPELLADYQRMLFQRALDFRAANTHMADTYDEFKAVLDKEGGFLMAPWCGDGECEKQISAETGATHPRHPVRLARRAGQVPRSTASRPNAGCCSPAPTDRAMTDDQLGDNLSTWDAWTQIHVESEFYDVASFRDGRRPIRLRDYELERGRAGRRQVAAPPAVPLRAGHACPGRAWAPGHRRRLQPGRDRRAPGAGGRAGDRRALRWSNLYDLPRKSRRAVRRRLHVARRAGLAARHRRWARVVAHFVKPGGFLYVTEIHPVAQVFDDEQACAPGELRLRYPYWEHREPLTFDVEGSYADRAAPTDGLVEHGWDHSLGEIVTALIDAGLRIELLHEFDFVDWELPWLVKGDDGRWRLPPGTAGQLPLFFSLRASKPA